MSKEIVEYLREYCRKEGYSDGDREVQEVLLESDHIYRKELSKHRWYNVFLYVVNINGRLIGFEWFECTGDNGPDDMGLEFDFDEVKEYEAFEETVTSYRPKEN